MDLATETTPTTPFRLLVLGDGSLRTIPLSGSRWVIGRAPECGILLRDPTVSRRHVLLEHGDAFRFQDLGGSNPLLLDGRPATQGVLQHGQTLLVGLTRLIVERRNRPAQVVADSGTTVILSREIIDDDLPTTSGDVFATAARRVLERIEWTFADLGGLADVADPLLDLALNLTGRRQGLIVRFSATGGIETLASLDAYGCGRDLRLPEQVLDEARRLGRPSLLRTQEADGAKERLAIPLGSAPDAMLVLEQATADAPRGQELLRLGRALGMVVWHRLQEATERMRLREDVQRLRFHGTTAHNALLASTRLQPLRQVLRERANTDAALLLLGEPGTEREDLARFLHVESSRAKAAFVVVSVATLPEWRRESELFGDGRALASALTRAAGGTLFVDQVDQLPVPLQERFAADLLALANIPPVDGSAAASPRLVLAASVAPTADPTVWSGALLEFVDPQHLTIPPLRSDARDVVALAELFLSEMGNNPDGRVRLLSERSKRLLLAYPWPGNVRELRQVLETAAARAGAQDIAPRHLPEQIAEPKGPGAALAIATLEEVEQRHIREVLQHVGGNRARAAQALGIAASTLYEKLKRYAIE
jgi:transcriptional regulator with AAA-type ATPase domain